MTKWGLIPPEIKNDHFYYLIIGLINNAPDIKTVLEIGASSGDGSTEAIMIGMGSKNIKLFSVEVCTERYEALRSRYTDERFHPYNVSSVSLGDFPSREQVAEFYNTVDTNLNDYPLDLVLSWLDKDVAYIKDNKVPENGIQAIKAEHGIETFDCVLIDGSEFSGTTELDLVYGTKYILLDDINSLKNYENHQRLSNDDAYICLIANYRLRNGFGCPPREKRYLEF
jgi:hypothetical protein